MKNYIFCFLFWVSILTINAQNPGINSNIIDIDYTSLTVPQHYTGPVWYINKKNLQEERIITDLPNDSSLLKSFPNMVSNVTVYKVNKNGELTLTGIGISKKNEVYQVIYDFSQTQTITWISSTHYHSALIGVGVRMVAKIKTKKAKINLSSPFSLAANSENIEGALEVRVSGVSSQKINGLIPTTTDLSPASISVALQAVATIKSHIYDNDTIITPQYLAYQKTNLDANTEALKALKLK